MKSKREIINEMSNKYPCEEKEIEIALEKLEVVSQSLNIPLEVIAEDICRIGSITRESGVKVGNALHSIYSRLTDHYLVEIGIDTTQSTKDVLEQLSIYYKKLKDDNQRTDFLVKIAGRFNLSSTAALLENR